MKKTCETYLKQMYGDTCEFRQGQFEAIKSVVEGNRSLVVQRTGWGKSTVYFIATKILRKRGLGVTILISPLLSLMRNQVESAAKIGLVAETINSSNIDDWSGIRERLIGNEIDILLISPERLGNEKFTTTFLPVIDKGIGLFVVDEAHCISDWGHDFRPDYQRIVNIINNLPSGTPVLATTATANDRVVDDIRRQLGDKLVIMKGPLLRESLHLQVIELDSQAERMAWIAENIMKIEGSGIIYCLTTADCNRVAGWLRKKGIDAKEYHSKLSNDRDKNRDLRVERETLLMNNDVKVLVSTIALGMGYDKPDLAFVIHFQRPGSLVSYYQQIGRAGRSLDDAIVVLLSGQEDDEILEYFINQAFPTPQEMEETVAVIESSYDGLSKNEILTQTNISPGRLDKCLKKLIVDNVLLKMGPKYSRTLNPWDRQVEKSKLITEQRYSEFEEMKTFTKTDQCHMKFIAEKLDDSYASECGKCENCVGEAIIATDYSIKMVGEAVGYLKQGMLEIPIRKRWPAGIVGEKAKNIPDAERNQMGRILSIDGDAGWGTVVKNGKYEDGSFSDDLLEASLNLINNSEERNCIEWVSYVPSLRRPNLVKEFAEKLASKLGLPIRTSLRKILDAPEQKSFQNSHYQCKNVYTSIEATPTYEKGPVLLVDDMFDSGWTLTVCGKLLRDQGVEAVYPFALAKSAK